MKFWILKQETIFQLLILLTALIFQGCKQIYDPPALKKNPGFLVVDGFLNNGNDTTFIKLTRTKQLEEGPWNAAETNASLTVEDLQGAKLYSFERLNEEGVYFIPALSLNINKKYKLRIVTGDNRQYLSNEIIVKKTPAIDSINWRKTDEGIMIYTTTHDPLNNTKYYRWDYTETWEYHSYYYTSLKYENGVIAHRKFPEEQVLTCWTIENSSDLMTASSVQLSQDVIYQKPVRLIPYHSIEIGVKYSILLNQYALTDSAYYYLQNLEKITEQTGSLMDPQPGLVKGNINCTSNPEETVIGFVTASSLETKRIFIEKVEVLPWNYRLYCNNPITIEKENFEDFFGGFAEFTPIMEIYENGDIVAAQAANTLCVDCTSRGGTNVKPDFWP